MHYSDKDGTLSLMFYDRKGSLYEHFACIFLHNYPTYLIVVGRCKVVGGGQL